MLQTRTFWDKTLNMWRYLRQCEQTAGLRIEDPRACTNWVPDVTSVDSYW